MKQDFYRAFEDKYRGSRETIKARLKAYLPFISPIRNTDTRHECIDLGCGRGEWLELLTDEGFTPTGIDLDQGMLAECRIRGLNARQGDALAYLKNLPDGSQSIVSAFHVVEHISFDELRQVVSHALRVLKEGGLLILETPNPENLVVATNSFYLDPTHVRPLPPGLLSFLTEFEGFTRTKVLRLQEPVDLHKEDPSLLDVLSSASPDYAVVAQKAGPETYLANFDQAFSAEYGISSQELAGYYSAATDLFKEGVQRQLNAIAGNIQRLQEQLSNSTEEATRTLGSLLNDIHREKKELMDQLRQSLERVEVVANEARDAAAAAVIAQQDASRVTNEARDAAAAAVIAQQDTFHLTTALTAMRQSHSWRITAPLRWASTQWTLLRQHGATARLQALGKRLIALPPAADGADETPGDVGDKKTVPLAPSVCEIIRYPVKDAQAALQDPALQSLPRPTHLEDLIESSLFAARHIEHEPIRSLKQLREGNTTVSVVLVVDKGDPDDIERSIQSCLRQTAPSWEVIFLVGPQTSAAVDRWLDGDWRFRRHVSPNENLSIQLIDAVACSTCEFVGLLQEGDVVDDDLIRLIGNHTRKDSAVDIVYTDELQHDADRPSHPIAIRKPDWSPVNQRSVNMLGRFCAIRKSIVLQLPKWETTSLAAAEYGLLTEASCRAKKIVHISEVLYQRGPRNNQKPGGFFDADTLAQVRTGMQSMLAREQPHHVAIANSRNHSINVKPPVLASIEVTLVILTGLRRREVPGRGNILLVENCVHSIIENTCFRNFKLIVVDDGELPDSLAQYLRAHGHRSVSYQGVGPFSFAKKSNFATSLASSGIVVLLNDDLEVIASDWLDWMVGFACQPEVGIVGAKLLYPNDSIQHAGITIGMNGACGHIFHDLPDDGSEYLGLASIDRNCSAVTGAAMAYRKDFFEGMGGFDEFFRVDYNDIDFCLRCVDQGYQVVFASQALLYHFHNSTFKRPHDDSRERAEFISRWTGYVDSDPHFTREMLHLADQPVGGEVTA